MAVSPPGLDRPIVESHLSAHPTDPRRLLAAAMVVGDPHAPFETSRLSVYTSSDGGISWREGGFPWFGYDPWTALRADGSALLVWLGGTDPATESRPIRIFRSADGGATWSSEVETIAGEFDGAKLATSSGGGDHVILAATHFAPEHADMRSRVAVHRVGWLRATEAAPAPVFLDNGPSTRIAAQPLAREDGQVWVAALSVPVGGSTPEVWAHRSTDGGRSFPEKRLVSTRVSPGTGYAQLVASPPGAKGDRVVFVRALRPPHADGGVWANVSADRGRTWSAERRVDRFADGPSVAAQVPAAAFTREGVLGVSWIDRRGDPAGRRNRLYFAWSGDGGLTFSVPIAVSDLDSDPLTPANGATSRLLPGGGHYLGLSALADGGFHAVWSDSRDGAYALFSVRLARQ